MYTKVNIQSDGDGHDYIIPSKLKDDFNYYVDKPYTEFEDKFGKYRVNGDVNNIQLYISNDENSELNFEVDELDFFINNSFRDDDDELVIKRIKAFEPKNKSIILFKHIFTRYLSCSELLTKYVKNDEERKDVGMLLDSLRGLIPDTLIKEIKDNIFYNVPINDGTKRT